MIADPNCQRCQGQGRYINNPVCECVKQPWPDEDTMVFDAPVIEAVQRLLERGKATLDTNGYLRCYPDRVDHLEHVIDRDRYVVAHGVKQVEDTIRAHSWVLEGRGPYEWDDDDYRREFGFAIEQIRKAMEPLRKVAWDKTDCTGITERVLAAKEAAAEMLRQPIGHREMIAADLFGDPRDAQIEKLTEALENARGLLDSPVMRRRLSGDTFYDDVIKSIKDALPAEETV